MEGCGEGFCLFPHTWSSMAKVLYAGCRGWGQSLACQRHRVTSRKHNMKEKASTSTGCWEGKHMPLQRCSSAQGDGEGWISYLVCLLATSEAIEGESSRAPGSLWRPAIMKALLGGWYAPKGLKSRLEVQLDLPHSKTCHHPGERSMPMKREDIRRETQRNFWRC